MIAGPFIFMFGLILLLILLLVGSRKKIQGLVFISKIGLVMISFPLSYTAGVILCH